MPSIDAPYLSDIQPKRSSADANPDSAGKPHHLHSIVASVTDEVLSRTLSGPEHQQVRLPTIEGLEAIGWDPAQLRWNPEWRVPKSPHDAAKREAGKSFAGWPVDLAIFDEAQHNGDWEHILAICEFKAPTLNEGASQLEIYLTREPRARMGYWSNGSQSLRVYKLPNGHFQHLNDRGLPHPGEDFERPSERPLTYDDLNTPTNGALRAIFKRLLDAIVSRDSQSTRSDGQLNELCNLLLLKLESDTIGSYDPDKILRFQLSRSGERETARLMRKAFEELQVDRPEIFKEESKTPLRLDDHTIQEVVYELSGLNLLKVQPEAISEAFQVFRRANLKAGEGQYFTPQRVIQSAVKMMDIQLQDKVIDPACGTGGFLVEIFLSLVANGKGERAEAAVRTWAHRSIFGVDKDSINIKLTRAVMVSLGDGSANIHIGDSIREDRWHQDYPHLETALSDGSFTAVITNPPFGRNLKVSKLDSRRNRYSISASTKRNEYQDLEIGLVFMERAYRLLKQGGRLGIILPETYFFSSSYQWLPDWLEERFHLRGVLNIPMEAFQGFCRAKTNFYVFEKK